MHRWIPRPINAVTGTGARPGPFTSRDDARPGHPARKYGARLRTALAVLVVLITAGRTVRVVGFSPVAL